LNVSISGETVSGLLQPAVRAALTERASQTPLGNLARFLGHTAKTPALKPVSATLCEDLFSGAAAILSGHDHRRVTSV
jgi:hypothetical protein